MHASILRYFVAVARTGSIRKASGELHIASSAVSRQIRKLEEELGTHLFERLPNGLQLTQAGRATLLHARETLQEFEYLKSNIGALTHRNVGLVRIASLDSFLVYFLPDQIMGFHENNPEADFRVQSGSHTRIGDLVANGDADIGVTFDLSHPSDTEIILDVHIPLMAMVSRNHPLASRSSVTLQECAEYDLLLHFDNEPISSAIALEMSVFERVGRALVRSNNLNMLRSMVLLGAGVAFFTPVGFVDELSSGQIVGVPLQGTRHDTLRLGMLVRRGRRLSHVAEAFAQQLSTAFSELLESLKGSAWKNQEASMLNDSSQDRVSSQPRRMSR